MQKKRPLQTGAAKAAFWNPGNVNKLRGMASFVNISINLGFQSNFVSLSGLGTLTTRTRNTCLLSFTQR